MKKLFALILVFCMLISFIPCSSTAAEDSLIRDPGVPAAQTVMTKVEPLNYDFQPPSTNWVNLISGELPAAFAENKISYQLADNVLEVNETVSKSIASAGQLLSGSMEQKLLPNKIVAEGGYVPTAILDTAAKQKGREIKNGTIVVDESTGTAFKVVSPTVYTGIYNADKDLQQLVKPLQGTYAVTKPALHEVIKDFELEEDTIRLTRGNISGFAPNIEKNLVIPSGFKQLAFNDSLNDFKHISKDPLIKLQFTNEKLDAKLGDGSPISVTVSGGIGIDSIDLTGRYSGFEGYRIEMTIKQESYLNVILNASVKDEVRIPILGIDVPFGIGRVTGGVFAIVGLDGTLRLEIDAREFTSATLGVRGSTKFYVPTSAHPIFDQEFKCDGDVDLKGDIDGYLKFGPMLGIELFGFDLVGAGVFLGTGVQVQEEGKFLNVHLYGIFNVYVKFAGEHFNLANYHPTILTKKQADTAGYRIKFLEAFVKPGRVGGTIETENDAEADGYAPSPNQPYRILVVPKGESFNPNDPNDVNKASIRKYPASGYAMTNDEGEFIQEDDNILSGGDQAFLEFKEGDFLQKVNNILSDGNQVIPESEVKGPSYFSDPVSPTLPFEKITITAADYYNDFVTGQVQPIRVINWHAKKDDPLEQQYEWTYYNNGIIFVNPYQSHNYNVHVPWGGQAVTRTDKYGNFDTRNPLISIITGKPVPNAFFDVYENPESWGARGGFDLTLDDHEATTHARVQYKSSMAMSFSRVLDEVEGSFQRIEEDGKIIDRMVYDEYIWIVNPNGTRTVSDEEFCYWMDEFSTQDFHFNDTDYRTWSESDRASHAAISGKPGLKKLQPVLDENGKPTGTTLLSQRVTVEWVWQAHPKPIKITSVNHTETTTSGGSFPVTATGYAPFTYTLKGAPQGIVINDKTGLITIPTGLAEKAYTFTIHVEEDRTLAFSTLFGKSDPYEGNDPSPPAEQLFTLTVKGTAVSTETPPTKEPEQTEQPPETKDSTKTAKPELTAPVIVSEQHGYQFSKLKGGGDLTVPIKATGSTPITFSLVQVSNPQIQQQISIDPVSGLLTARDGIAAGTYNFTIKAQNDVGSDTQECSLNVTENRTPPVFAEERHGYKFAQLKGGGDLSVPIKASGSAPITYSLVQPATHQLPGEISINPVSGVLTVRDGIIAGTYNFVIKAQNDVGSDTQECSLTVAERRTPPVIVQERHGYTFTKLKGGGDLTVQIKATGSTPITYSLVQPVTHQIPKEISISSVTGVLTVKDPILPGNYSFTIQARNDIGQDTQDCKLEVTSPIIPTRPPVIPTLPSSPTRLNAPAGRYDGITLLSSSSGVKTYPGFTTENSPKIMEVPPNKLTIRYDDPDDVYTNDRYKLNGALFIRWHSSPGVLGGGLGVGKMFLDESPRCDNYHYWPVSTIPKDKMDKIEQSFKQQLSAYQRGDVFLGERLDNVGLLGQFNNFTVNQITEEVTYLKYGSLLKEMNAQKSGSFQVDLNKNTGTMITGKYFVGLKNNSNAQLSFLQDGASITFKGKDVKTASEYQMFDFGFAGGALHEADIMTAAGSGGQNFTYGFAHHGELPGMAEFAITTGIDEGTKVNIYKFDAETKQFTLIAKQQSVGAQGVVTYKNNTMSEYLITTNEIANAITPLGAIWYFLGIGLLAALAGAAAWFILLKKKKSDQVS